MTTSLKQKQIQYLRVKKPIAIREEKLQKARNIFSEFEKFTDGYRVLFLIHRNKEGGDANNSKVKKIVSRNRQDFFNALYELVCEMEDSELTLRIYSSLNDRDFKKAVHQFKIEQLEADYCEGEKIENFYLDAKNGFISALMMQGSRASNYFMFDIDTVDGIDNHGKFLNALYEVTGEDDPIIMQYRTKNGWHVITKPFNHTKIKMPQNCEWKKDGLLLLAY